MSESRAEITEGVVMRLPPREIENELNIDGHAPNPGDFALSSTEKKQAEDGDENGGHIGSLSVWDRGRTKPEEAYGFFKEPCVTRLILDINVEKILEIPKKLELPIDLHVFRDPLKSEKDGADGHCALENVWSNDRQIRKKIRLQLAVVSSVVGIITATSYAVWLSKRASESAMNST